MNNNVFIEQLDSIINDYQSMQQRSQKENLQGLPKADRQALVSRAIAATHSISGPESSYSKDIKRILEILPVLHAHTSSIIGVAAALRNDIDHGYMSSLVELIHADIFADFLEMAQYLNNTGYKDAAAVIAGSTLESHIKKLCNKNGIAIEALDRNNKPKAIKADTLNAELMKAGVYAQLELKSVTFWLGLRNDAAHGDYSKYDDKQVALHITGIQQFIAKYPA